MPITFTDAFPQRYLRADDVTQSVTMEVLRVVPEIAYGDSKYVVYFNEDDRGLVLNPALFQQFEKITGSEDAEQWSEHRVTLFRDVIKKNGKTIHVIGARRPQSSNQDSAGASSKPRLIRKS